MYCRCLEISHTTLPEVSPHCVRKLACTGGINDASLTNSRIQDQMLAPTLADIFQTASCCKNQKKLVCGDKIQNLQLATFAKGPPSHVGSWIYHDGRVAGLHESCQGFHRLPWGIWVNYHMISMLIYKRKNMEQYPCNHYSIKLPKKSL